MSRRELLWPAAIVLLTIAVPLAFEELYPFSRVGLFADAPRVYCEYVVTDQLGRPLPPLWFGLHRRYYGVRGHNSARRASHLTPVALHDSIDVFGEVAPPEDVVRAVRRGLETEELPGVLVWQIAIGPIDDDHVGMANARSFWVTRP